MNFSSHFFESNHRGKSDVTIKIIDGAENVFQLRRKELLWQYRKKQKWNILQISFVMLCCLMHSIINIIFGWKICSKFNFISIFLILANFAAFLDHTKENADVSKNGGYF